jgi:hypothetical protein
MAYKNFGETVKALQITYGESNFLVDALFGAVNYVFQRSALQLNQLSRVS